MSEKIVTRFPPSPTGNLHIGSVRTALFNYLFAKHSGGVLYLRFEDTDRERSKKEFEEDIVAGLQWLGLAYELPEAPRQSEHQEIYAKHIPALIEKGAAYEAEESKDSSGKKVVRFKNPNTVVSFSDLVRGEVRFDTTELGDFVIAKSLVEPLYHLAVVIDDQETGVTHIIRGDDHISNTPRQILLQEALGFPRPQYAHIPLILAPDKTKLSKRHGAVSVNEYRAQGFIPEALLNYLALLGWNPGGEQEVFSLQELTEAFTLERVHKGNAVFDVEKLKWFNHEHLKTLSNTEYTERLKNFGVGECNPSLVPLLKERARTLAEAEGLLKEYDFLNEEVSPTRELLLKGAKAETGVVKTHLGKVAELLQALGDEPLNPEIVKEAVFPYATEAGRGAVLWPMRVALSGREKSPDPFTLAALLGKEKTLQRLGQASRMLE